MQSEHNHSYGGALPWIVVLIVLALTSAVVAIDDPVSFAEIFSRM